VVDVALKHREGLLGRNAIIFWELCLQKAQHIKSFIIYGDKEKKRSSHTLVVVHAIFATLAQSHPSSSIASDFV
jgi:hypothetical protein